MKAEEIEPLLPSDADVQRYCELGYHTTGQVIPHDLLDAAGEALKAHQSGHRDRHLSADARFSDWQPGDKEAVRNNEFASLQNDVLRQACPFSRDWGHRGTAGAIGCRAFVRRPDRLQACCGRRGGYLDGGRLAH